MTDREKLIDVIYSMDICSWGWAGKIADHLLANGVTFAKNTDVPDKNVGKWIPVSERLPEENGDYLTTCRSMGVRFYEVLSFAKDGEAVDYYDLTAKKNVWYEYLSEYGYVSRTNVTHWMPLPEAPKEV